MNKSTVVRNGIAASIAAGALAVGGVGLAQAADETTDSETSSTEGRPGPGGPGGHGPGGFGDSAELAEALGVSEDELTAAFEAIRDDFQPEAREEGQEGTRPTEEDREARQGELAAALAEELGLSEADVQAALDEVRASHEAEHRRSLEDRLDTAVTDGDLTEADKASVLKAFDAGVLGGGPGGR